MAKPNWTVFLAYLDRAEKLLGQKQAVAKRLGIEPSRYTKLYNEQKYALNVENCLRLARLIKEPIGDVLRAAGKGDLATALDEHYGAVQPEGGLMALADEDIARAVESLSRLPEDVRRPFVELAAVLGGLYRSPRPSVRRGGSARARTREANTK